MVLSLIDWIILIAFFAISLFIGIYVSKRSGKNAENFFLSGRNMPWWLLGVSMVATTFAADTPGLVAGIVRQDGVAGNWVWWAFLLTGMLTVFFYAKLWRKSNITTDLEFYELRYSGKSAAFLRGFRALYLGVFFNIVIMATVCLAAIKIGHVLFGFSDVEILFVACGITLIYSMLGGLKGVLITDFIQFFIAMAGSIGAAYYVLQMPEINGMSELITAANVSEKISFFPDFSKPEVYIPLMIIPLAVQWWSVWYPGAEPGGGGYIVQRMLAAKDKNHATKATLFFTIMHYAVRPWPWIILGLASLVMYPNLSHLAEAFPNLSEAYLKNDLAYAAMLRFLPAGLLGLVVTSLVAAFMSTLSTHLNWGSSYVVNDFYVRFINPKASEKKKVWIGRISIFVMMFLAALLSRHLNEAKEAFDLLLKIGAGTGLLFILRWFWYRINPISEIVAMLSSFLVALILFLHNKLNWEFWSLKNHEELVITIIITSICWVSASLLTPKTSPKKIKEFEKKVYDSKDKFIHFKPKIVSFFAAVLAVYALLFSIGYLLYGKYLPMSISLLVSLTGFAIIIKFWKKIIA